MSVWYNPFSWGGQQLNHFEKARLLEEVKSQLDETDKSLVAGALSSTLYRIVDCQEKINVILNSHSQYQSTDRKRRERSFLNEILKELKKLIKDVEEAQYWEKRKVENNRKAKIEHALEKLRWIKKYKVEDMIKRFRTLEFGE